MVSNSIQKVSVKALFEKDGKILLVQDSKGVWELPGGRIEPEEEPVVSLRRELQEELGWVDVEILNIIDAWSFVSAISDVHKHIIVLVYHCQLSNQNIIPNDEYIDCKWFSMSEIEKINIREGYVNTIKKFLRSLIKT